MSDLFRYVGDGKRWEDSVMVATRMFSNLTDYTFNLSRKGECLSRSEALKKDIIDLRELSTSTTAELIRENVKADFFYDSIPCFNEGVVRLGETVTYFKLLELELDEKRMKFHIDVYEDTLEDGRRYWFLLTSGDYINEEVLGFPTINELGMGSRSALYHLLSSNVVTVAEQYQKAVEYGNWDENTKLQMRGYAEKFSELLFSSNSMRKDDKEETFFANKFISSMILVNWLFAREKLSRPVKQSKPKKKVKTIQTFEVAEPIKKIRMLGGVKFVSKERPERSTSVSVRRYKVASWKVRGHMSKSKYGKPFYVPETTHHRKAKDTVQTKVPQRIIKGI